MFLRGLVSGGRTCDWIALGRHWCCDNSWASDWGSHQRFDACAFRLGMFLGWRLGLALSDLALSACVFEGFTKLFLVIW